MKPHFSITLLAAAMMLGATPTHAADDLVAQAKAYTEQVTQPARAWDGPTTGPAAQANKTIVYVSSDQRNGGPRGVSEGMAQAAKVIGWNFRILDGQNSIIGRTAAMSQAIALKPDGIMLGGVDTREQAVLIKEAVANGITVLGWHTVAEPGPVPEHGIFFNIGTDPLDVSRAAVMYVIAASDGKAGVVIFTDSTFEVAIAKSNAMADLVRQCSTCTLLRVEDTPLSDTAARIPQLTATFLQRYGKQWTWAMAINDLPFDFMTPTLQQLGLKGTGPLLAMSAGDGSTSAFQRVRNNDYQVGTVAEPVILHGWQAVDEFNRAFAGQPPSGYSAPVHLVTPENIAFDGGPNDVYDPDNGYQDIYRRIWGR